MAVVVTFVMVNVVAMNNNKLSVKMELEGLFQCNYSARLRDSSRQNEK